MEVTNTGSSYQYGAQSWKVIHDKWYVQIFGTSPYSNGGMKYSWLFVEKSRVPKDLIRNHG